MSRRVVYALDDGSRVEFETDPVDGWVEAGPDEVIAGIGEAVSPLVAGAKVVMDRVKEAGPDGVEVKFGVKVSGTANWVVAKAATEANFEVKLTWSPAAPQRSGDAGAAG